MEIWDAYDRNENKINMDLIRDQIIPKGYYHLVCEAIIKHIDGEYLLMQRDYCKTFPGKFECSAGGSALKGEDAVQAITREIYEETGLKPIELKILNKCIYDEDSAIFYSFIAIVNSPKSQIVFQKGETIGYKWLNLQELLNFIETEEFIQGRGKIRIKNNIEKSLIMLNDELQNYLDNTKKPWGELFYKIIWEQLSDFNKLKILDFGSGLGITADYLARNNEVTAIEPDEKMINLREHTNNYKQLIGGIDRLRELKSNSFDVIVCHNVLEYTDERIEIMQEFLRILKNDGILSIVKHNKCGRIMQKVVFENNIDQALSLLNGGELEIINFGKINYYSNEELLNWAKNFKVEKILGVRTFFGLQHNDVKSELNWQSKMLEIEMKVSDIESYKNISFFNHIILKKI